MLLLLSLFLWYVEVESFLSSTTSTLSSIKPILINHGKIQNSRYISNTKLGIQLVPRTKPEKSISKMDPIDINRYKIDETIIEPRNPMKSDVTTTSTVSSTTTTTIYSNIKQPRLSFDGNSIDILYGNNRHNLLSGSQYISAFDFDTDTSSAFLSFKFDSELSQQDAILGKLDVENMLTLSRIKRWWMAPMFSKTVDNIPVESQFLLLQIPTISNTLSKNREYPSRNHDSSQINPLLSNQQYSQQYSSSFYSDNNLDSISHSSSQDFIYILLLPLIDYESGFRATLYGHEGDDKTPKGMLSVRMESGDRLVTASLIEDAVYIATGKNPYELIESAYTSIADRMGTFRTRRQKLLPKGLDSFGFCTWDAFYSKVDSMKVKEAVTSLTSVGVPPRFVIVDDGWQSTGLQEIKIEDKSMLKKEEGFISSTSSSSLSSVPSSLSSSSIPSMITIEGKDGELSGAQIDGNVATKAIAENGNLFQQLVAKFVSEFYIKQVESASPDSWTIQLWSHLSRTIFKDKLIDFFNSQTDFSKRLLSWKANSKFEDSKSGKTLKGFVKSLKSDHGIDYVFFWHALSGYWGGVSENLDDDMGAALSKTTEQITNDIQKTLNKSFFSKLKRFLTRSSRKAIDIINNNNNIISNKNLPSSSSSSSSDSVKSVLSILNSPPIQRTFSNPTPHLLRIEPALSWDPSALVGVGGVARGKLDSLYQKIHQYLADSGADGVKVDAQAGIGAFGGSTAAQACVQSMERSVREAFGKLKVNSTNSLLTNIKSKSYGMLLRTLGPFRRNKPLVESSLSLEACMCHSTETLYNYYETSLIRSSDDFYPKDIASQTVHIVSCAYNSIMLGEIGIPDWDMFHSKHLFASMHAMARSISGGPVYVSDSPGNHDPELLRRIVFLDGRILRTMLPSRPTIDCLFTNPMTDEKTALKTWTMNKVNGAIGVYNVQGSVWDRKARKYYQNKTIPRPIVAHIKASDIADKDFITTSMPQTIFNPVHDQSSSSSFMAWSAVERELKLLNTKDSIFDIYLDCKQSDVISVSHLYSIELQGKSRNILAKLLNWITGHSKRRMDKKMMGISETVENSVVQFSPIGLIDMFNAGGAVEDVRLSIMSAKIIARGLGNFGIYVTSIPKSITVDGDRITNYVMKPLDKDSIIGISGVHVASSPMGYMIQFELKSKKLNQSSLENKIIKLEW